MYMYANTFTFTTHIDIHPSILFPSIPPFHFRNFLNPLPKP